MKLPAILLSIAGGGLALLAWSQPWFELVLTAGAGTGGDAAIAVPGQIASPAVAALGLAALALGGALAIAGRGIRMVLGVLGVVLGGCVLLAAGVTLGNPVAAVGPVVTDATGVAGARPTAELVASVDATAWPVIALVSGALIVAAGVLVLATGLAWPASSRRYRDARRPSFEDTADAAAGDASALDASGLDATDAAGASGGDAAPGSAEASGGPQRPPTSSDRAIDDWDDLTRGDDPTR